MASDLNVERKQRDGVTVLAPAGEIDIASAPQLEQALTAARPEGDALVLDLRGVEFIDTSGIRLIVREIERADADGYRFVLVRGAPRIQRVLEIAGLGQREGLVVDDPAAVSRGDATGAGA